MTTKQSESVLLSLLGPRPVFWYDESFDEVFCAWNGIVMTQKHALMLVSEFFWNQNPTPEMKRIADRDLIILYNAGAFDNSNNWAHIIENYALQNIMHTWYKRKIKPVFDRYLKETKPAEVYSWFNFKEFAKI